MKEIKLNFGKSTIVDDFDFPNISIYKMYAKESDKTFYVYIRVKGKLMLLHRFLFNLTDSKLQIDHIDGNGLNNLRNNLRLCNNSQNNINRKKKEGLSSCYKGVCFNKSANKFVANIRINGVKKHLGLFNDEIEAAFAYDEMAKKFHGEFAKLNF